jgi:UDP-N-acetylglucosamine acyltransferase
VITIHPTAFVSPQVTLGDGVYVGPFCYLESGSVIGDRCVLSARVTIKEQTHLGPDNQISEGAVLGGRPQHLRAGAAVGGLRIGRANMIRENVTIHRAVEPQAWTTVGDENMIMVSTHVAHDCHIGNHTILANNVMLAGHVTIQDRAYLSGAVGVHQFCRVGRNAMVGGQSHITRDVAPFVTVDGESSRVVGLNIVGLRRNGFTTRDIAQLKAAYRLIYRSGRSWSEILAGLASDFAAGPAACLLEFLSHCPRGIVRERRRQRGVMRLADFRDDEQSEQEKKVG